MFTLRSTQTTPPPRETGKPHFAEDSFWSKREGHKFLKSIFDRLEESQDVSVVEIKQLADGRPALAFNHHGTTYEIRFPDDFPRSVPEVLVIRSSQQAGRFFWKRKDGNTDFPRLEEVRRIINALGLLDDHREIGISEQQ
jgi:hemin uptake protein HemP